MPFRKPIPLQHFCDPNPENTLFADPWKEGEFLYATDSKIAIRCEPEVYDGPLGSHHQRPRVAELLSSITQVTVWHDLPALPTCQHCNEEGETPDGQSCYQCRIMLENRRVQRKYANKLKALPNLKWGVVRQQSTEPIYFQFDGGVGILMPVIE